MNGSEVGKGLWYQYVPFRLPELIDFLFLCYLAHYHQHCLPLEELGSFWCTYPFRSSHPAYDAAFTTSLAQPLLVSSLWLTCCPCHSLFWQRAASKECQTLTCKSSHWLTLQMWSRRLLPEFCPYINITLYPPFLQSWLLFGLPVVSLIS